MMSKLVFKDGSEFEGRSFGYESSVAGEVVFNTGMVGYPESLTDPSYTGQILIMTYPLIGNYGVGDRSTWESHKIHVSGLIVSSYIDTPSHFQSIQTLAQWLKDEHIPALEIKDTRFLTQKLRDKGTMLGKIIIDKDVEFMNPDLENLIAKVSTKKIIREGKGSKTVVLIDTGAKRNIQRCLLQRGLEVIIVPWDFDPFAEKLKFDALVLSNGPGDPKMADRTIGTIQKALSKKTPILGICLGNQLLALAAGGDTFKLKFGHRSQNQPCILERTKRCFLTTQNHGFAVGKIPSGFRPWFTNANDGTNEGIVHTKYPFMSVQFHPEASAGPTDTEWVFDEFLEFIK
ncbi:MAG: glutamine-hydrolyzing carbamoyl-phosphate synthase small subunit [bacterium]|nr:glutamine-hydrolyzing carbamoyl-phosphate synthase small subunit [bacterium]